MIFRKNIIPNKKWEVITWWDCGNHGSNIQVKNYYKFDILKWNYFLDKTETKNCSDIENISWPQNVRQDINIRETAWADWIIIQPILKWEQVLVIWNISIWRQKWYKVNYKSIIWWISWVWFNEDTSK